jgi:hypothetical protein
VEVTIDQNSRQLMNCQPHYSLQSVTKTADSKCRETFAILLLITVVYTCVVHTYLLFNLECIRHVDANGFDYYKLKEDFSLKPPAIRFPAVFICHLARGPAIYQN